MCLRVPPNAVGFPRRFREPVAMPAGGCSSGTGPPNARRSGIGASRSWSAGVASPELVNRSSWINSGHGYSDYSEIRWEVFVTELYESIADWWPVISPPSEYAEEAALYVEMIQGAARHSGSGSVREVLELGSGGGNNASHMKRAFSMTLVEPADRMRAEPSAQPRVHAPARRHALRPTRLHLRRGLRPRCDHVHDHRGRPARGASDRGGALGTRRRGAGGTRCDS